MMFRPMRRIDKQLPIADTLAILKRGQEGVLGTLCENGYPYTVVLNYVYYKDKIYIHCAKEGLKIDNITNYNKVSFSVFDQVEVLGESLNTKYQSITLFGRAKVMDATKEILIELIKKYAMIPTETANSMIDKEINITSIIEIEIDHITGKIGK